MMKSTMIVILTVGCFFVGCKSESAQVVPQINVAVQPKMVLGNTIESRFSPPSGYSRKGLAAGSFEEYLRTFLLHPPNREVRYFNGGAKMNQGHHVAVLDIDVGTKDLQQCADAIMRLRAEYLFERKEYDKIQFHFVSGFNATYANWRIGNRIRIQGNNASWYHEEEPSSTRASFNEYLEMVFMYAGTPSLEKELKPQIITNIQIGDVLIQGGRPGHAVLVVDLVENDVGQKMFLLAQS